MSFLSSIGSFFLNLGKLLGNALKASVENGLTDKLIQLALSYIKEAASKAIDNDAKRAYVVQALVNRGFPESLARLATELAYQLFKKELGKIPGA